MPAADALERVAVWLEDCDDHVALNRAGGLPAPPFKLSQAWVVVRAAAEARGWTEHRPTFIGWDLSGVPDVGACWRITRGAGGKVLTAELIEDPGDAKGAVT